MQPCEDAAKMNAWCGRLSCIRGGGARSERFLVQASTPSSLARSAVEYMRQESRMAAIYSRGMLVKYGACDVLKLLHKR